MLNVFFHNRRLLAVTILMIVVAGISAFLSLPRLEDPELVPRRALAFTRVPGANASRVETLVTKKIEDRLLDEIEQIKELESISRAGISTITIELGDEVPNVDEIWSRVRDELREAEADLPEDALPPSLENLEIRGHALIAAVTWADTQQPNHAILIRLAQELEELLRGLRGTESVEVYGAPKEEISVAVEPSKLAAIGLTASDVARQIKMTDSKVPSGIVRGTQSELLVEVAGELDSLEQIRQIPIQFGSNGQFVLLRDLGSVSKGIVQPSSDLALIDGKAAIAVGAFVESEYRADIWASAANEALAQFQNELPQGIGLETIFEQTQYTENRLSSLAMNMLMGGISVLLVVFMMMGWRSAILVGSALPLSALMVLSGMWIFGIPMHQMSVTGLILALGLLIDNAIVMVDEVAERLRSGSSAAEAISKSVGHLFIPLLGSTLTTIFAFMPIALMPGSPGEFVGTIAITVILSLSSSLFLAMTVVPALAGILSRFAATSGTAWWERGISIQWVSKIYRRLLERLFARPALGIALSAVLPVAGLIAASQLTEQFFPPTGRDMFYIEVELPKNASIAQSQTISANIRNRLMRRERIENLHWFFGESAPNFYYNIVRDQDDAAYYAQAMVQIDSGENVERLIRSVQSELDEAYPQARVLVRQLEQGPPFAAPIELRIYGPDLTRLEEFGDQARLILSQTPDVIHVRTLLSEGLPKLFVDIDEEKTRRAGIDKLGLARQLNSHLEGAMGGSIREDSEELPVRVRLSGDDRSSLDKIASLDVLPNAIGFDAAAVSAQGFIPISTLGELRLTAERSAVTRRNGYRVNTVQAFISAGVLPGKVLKDFVSRLDQAGFELPAGYRFDFGGETEERAAAVSGLLSSVPILAVLMIATLVLSLHSFRLAGVIGAVGMMSLGLGMGSLWVFGYPFGFMAIVGSMGLVGIAINDAIVVLAAIQEDDKARSGQAEAVVDVVMRSTRHVLSTTVTTIAGFTPLILAGGGFWPPLAVAIAGGVVGATGLALVFVPAAKIMLALLFYPRTAATPETPIAFPATVSRNGSSSRTQLDVIYSPAISAVSSSQ